MAVGWPLLANFSTGVARGSSAVSGVPARDCKKNQRIDQTAELATADLLASVVHRARSVLVPWSCVVTYTD